MQEVVQMKKVVINHFYNMILKYNHYSEEEKEKLLYGLEGLYLTISKLVVIALLAIIFHIIKEVFIVIVLFNIIRYTAFGFHAEKSYQCLITSCLFFIGFPLLFKYIILDKTVINILVIISIISYLFYAPADTVKRPIYDKKMRIIRKVATIVIAIIYYICILSFDYSIGKLFLIALLIESIMINPILYKIFKQPYANYRKN